MSTVPSHMVAGMGRVAGDGLPVGNVLKPLKPRTSSRRDHETWDEELKELAARLGLEAMHSMSPMPSMAVCALRSPKASQEQLETLLQEETAAWQKLNTA